MGVELRRQRVDNVVLSGVYMNVLLTASLYINSHL